MTKNIYKELQDESIFQYGSEELLKFERQLTKYFTREYIRHKDNCHTLDISDGPLALVSQDLADEHYDAEIRLFKNFLDPKTMSYSMAYFGEEHEEILTNKRSLSEAQLDKFKLIAKRMRLTGDETLLNLGCGFGYFEAYLLETYPELSISSITHSKDQHDSILQRRENPEDPLSSDRFKLYYGEIGKDIYATLGNEKYDVVCSVGLMEHINNIKLFFELINGLLSDHGRMFHHLIVSRDLLPQLLDSDKTMIGDYFPGGKVIPYDALHQKFDNLILKDSWFVNGCNYWKTLDYWHANFWNNIGNIYPDVMDSKRIRHWNNYFVLCKAMFYPDDGNAYGNGQYLFQKSV